MERNILIIFDFWGAGNMGDDLMVDGFLRALQQLQQSNIGKISCLCNCDISSQRIRFPQLTWVDSNDEAALKQALDHAELIIGFGGTPFQLTSGDWLLRHMVRMFGLIKPQVEVIFINVGAETEIRSRESEFAGVLRRINRCSTRDDFSRQVLAGLNVKSPSEIHVGADLANVSLQHLKNTMAVKIKHPLGIVLGFDTLSPEDLLIVNKFLEKEAA